MVYAIGVKRRVVVVVLLRRSSCEILRLDFNALSFPHDARSSDTIKDINPSGQPAVVMEVRTRKGVRNSSPAERIGSENRWRSSVLLPMRVRGWLEILFEKKRYKYKLKRVASSANFKSCNETYLIKL